MKNLTVLSYNIHKGFSFNNRKFVLARIREAIRLVHADLVLLQEVQGHHSGHRQNVKDWPEEPQFEFLADEVWPHFAYGKNAVYHAGHHGNAILSKYPILFSENIDLSTNPLEKRGLLHAIIDFPKKQKPLHAMTLHLDLFERGRSRQIGQLCDRIESHVPTQEPLVIGGDFNDWRQRVSGQLQDRLGVKEAYSTVHRSHAKTFPSWLPALKLDRIYCRGLEIKDAACLTGLPWSKLSDHGAIKAELEL